MSATLTLANVTFIDEIHLPRANDVGYIATVQLGTPPQDFKVLMDSGSADFWVAAEQCQEIQEQAAGGAAAGAGAGAGAGASGAGAGAGAGQAAASGLRRRKGGAAAQAAGAGQTGAGAGAAGAAGAGAAASCGQHQTLGTQSSSSFVDSGKPFQVTYGSGEVAGTIIQDNVVMAGLALNKHVFGTANQETVQFTGAPFDGLMGLAQSVSICRLMRQAVDS